MDIFALRTGECVKLESPYYNEVDVLCGYECTNANEDYSGFIQQGISLPTVSVGIDSFISCHRFLERIDRDHIA